MSKPPRIDFDLISKVALGSARRLLTEWMPGGDWNGREYKPLNPTRDDRNKGSFVINADTGKWIDNSTNDSGGDLISLYAYIRFMSQYDAALAVAGMVGIDVNQPDHTRKPALRVVDQTEPIKDKLPRSPWEPVLPVPDGAPVPPVAHYVRGRPDVVYTYYDKDGHVNGYIYRFTTSDGGKETLPVVYARNTHNQTQDWRWMAFPEPRPLFNLHLIAEYPDWPVLLVEGEKCAVTAEDLIGFSFNIVTWPGGTKAINKVDWSPLIGRKIIAWADCDAKRRRLTDAEKQLGVDPESAQYLPEHEQPGMRAMIGIQQILQKLDSNIDFKFVDIPKPGDKPDGWDIADAIGEGMTADDLKAFIGKVRGPSSDSHKSKESSTSGVKNGVELFIKNGNVVACHLNIYEILRCDERWQGVLAFNEFSYTVTKLKPPPYPIGKAGEWDDNDDVQTSMWLTKEYQFSPKPLQVREAAEALAHANGFHPVRNYLDSLEWDGTERLDCWITEYIGAPLTPYTMRVARWFLMGMVARVMEPGVKFDCCLVLEGTQGRRKSSMLRVLAGEWFGDTDLDLNNKDSMNTIRGKWLYEFAELGSLARSEATRQKSFLSRQVDIFRPPFGRGDLRSPRQLVFGGSTNDWAWNKDDTGGRRFWPIECLKDIDCDGLQAVRDQLFAEAYAQYKAGKRYWPTSEEQRRIFDPEQIKRHQTDGYIDILEGFLAGKIDLFPMTEAAEFLKIDPARLSRDIQTRIGKALTALGCERVERRTSSIARFWYRPPVSRGDSTTTGNAAREDIDAIPF